MDMEWYTKPTEADSQRMVDQWERLAACSTNYRWTRRETRSDYG